MSTISSIYHALLAIFGFAAGGYVYGPTQTFLIRNFVHMVGDALAMVAYTVYLGVYALVLDDLFKAVPGSGMMGVILVGGFLMVAGMRLLKRLQHSLEGGNDSIASRIAAAVERPGVSGGYGYVGGGGHTVGMAEASHPLHAAAMLAGPWAGFKALNAVNSSFGAGWLTGDGRARIHAQRAQYDYADHAWSSYQHLSAGRTSGALNALRRAAAVGSDPTSRDIYARLHAAESAGAGLDLHERDLQSTLEAIGMHRGDVDFLFGTHQPENERWHRIFEAVSGLSEEGFQGPAMSSALRAFGLTANDASNAVRDNSVLRNRHPNPPPDRFVKLYTTRDALEGVKAGYLTSGDVPHARIAQLRVEAKKLKSYGPQDLALSHPLDAGEEAIRDQIIAAASNNSIDQLGAVFDRAQWHSLDQRVLTGTVDYLGSQVNGMTREFLRGCDSFDEAERNRRLAELTETLQQLNTIERYGISVGRNPYPV